MEEEACYCLLSLQTEVQNNAEVTKPVLNELDIAKFCGNLHENGPTVLISAQVDQVLSDMFSHNTEKEIKVIGLFGRQSQVRERLQEMSLWSKKDEWEQGIFAIEPQPNLIIIFSWIADVHFQVGRIRETVTQMLRFVTSVSDRILCCVSLEELEAMEKYLEQQTEGDKRQTSSLKIKFHKHRDDEDSVSASKFMDDVRVGVKKAFLISGSHPALVETSKQGGKTVQRQRNVKFDSYREVLGYLKEQGKSYSLSFSEQFNPEELLKAIGKWPEGEIQAIKEASRLRMESFEMEKASEAQAAAERFATSLLSPMLGGQDEMEYLEYLSDLTTAEVILRAPMRLKESINDLEYLWCRKYDKEYDQLIEYVENGREWPNFGRKWWMNMRSHQDFMSKLEIDLVRIRKSFMAGFMATADQYKPFKTRMRMEENRKDKEIKTVIMQQWKPLVASFSSSSQPQPLRLNVAVLCNAGEKITCFVDDDFPQPPQTQYTFRELKETEKDCMAKSLELPRSEDRRSFYTINPISVLLVAVSGTSTSLQVITFTTSEGFSRKPSTVVTDIKRFPKVARHWAFNFSDRTIAFTFGESNNVTDLNCVVYHFNESFSRIERPQNIAVSVKCSLMHPIVGVYLTCTYNTSSLLLLDEQGWSQRISLRSYQASRVLQLHPDGLPSSYALVALHDQEVLGFIGSHEASSSICIRCYGLIDDRPLPEHRIPLTSRRATNAFTAVTADDRLYILNEASGKLCGFRVHIKTQSDSFRLSRSECSKRDAKNENPMKQHWLWAFFDTFEKFPVVGALEKGTGCANVKVSLVGPPFSLKEEFQVSFERFMQAIMQELLNLCKPLHGLDLATSLEMFGGGEELRVKLDAIASTLQPRGLVDFVRELICFVPVQICRAENNQLKLHDPNNELHGQDAAELAASIRFGLLTPFLQSWNQKCIVLSSMGKQSTGKSYFLNHLSGASFAISGARCTDGAWMTLRVLDGKLLIVLDFEGLGSFERTEQEDVFLSVLNSAVSDFTVFRIEMRYDKSIDELFKKFQQGTQLIKGNSARLYRGTLCFSVKDVNLSDKASVEGEFGTKLKRVLTSNVESNFLSIMYNGEADIKCSPPLGTVHYYNSVQATSEEIEALWSKPDRGFQDGTRFLECIRLLMAKIHVLDWMSMDDSAMKLNLISVRQRLAGVIRHGAYIPESLMDKKEIPPRVLEPLATPNGDRMLVSFNQLCEKYPQHAPSWRKMKDPVSLPDIKVDLGPFSNVGGRALEPHLPKIISNGFEKYCQMRSIDPNDSKKRKVVEVEFDQWLQFLILRRKETVMQWITLELKNRQPDEIRVVEGRLRGLEHDFQRCQRGCGHCQLGCLLPVAHTGEHSCKTKHKCSGKCEFCSNELLAPVYRCSKAAGHEGTCECRQMEHSCGQPCIWFDSPNCDETCSLKTGHAGEHICSVQQHHCGEGCSARNCTGRCILSIEQAHSVHKCQEIRCAHECVMDGCMQICGCMDHFHGDVALSDKFRLENHLEMPDWNGPDGVHVCLNSHQCEHTCSCLGVCDIQIKLKTHAETFQGERGTFEYTRKEMNGSRKKCCRILPQFDLDHEGQHTCIEDRDAVHYCDERCPCCNYYCDKAVGHGGFHSTAHGNMNNTYLVADTRDVDIDDRKYRVGEAGVAEMCPLFCSKSGRGHVHFVPCEHITAEACTAANHDARRRHGQIELQTPTKMDELLHDYYWESFGWEDPCSCEADRELFMKCGLKCDAVEHEDAGETSYCVLDVWHPPAVDNYGDGMSYINGHQFECLHASESGKYHHIFVLDASGSMGGAPWNALLSALSEYVENRLQQDKNSKDVVSIITFNTMPTIHVEAEPIAATHTQNIRYSGGGTSFGPPLRAAGVVLSRIDFGTFTPVLLFFSDGHPGDPFDAYKVAEGIHNSYSKNGLEAFAVGFGAINLGVLKSVAVKLGGDYREVLTGTELAQEFRTISASLGTRMGFVARPQVPVVASSQSAKKSKRGGKKRRR